MHSGGRHRRARPRYLGRPRLRPGRHLHAQPVRAARGRGQVGCPPADGTIPVRDLFFSYWFSLSALRPSVTSTCPEDHWEAVQLAQSTGGAVIVLSQREIANATTGAFSIPVGITATAPGRLLLCAYTDDGATQTLVTTSMMLDIKPASRRRGRASACALHEDPLPPEARPACGPSGGWRAGHEESSATRPAPAGRGRAGGDRPRGDREGPLRLGPALLDGRCHHLRGRDRRPPAAAPVRRTASFYLSADPPSGRARHPRSRAAPGLRRGAARAGAASARGSRSPPATRWATIA